LPLAAANQRSKPPDYNNREFAMTDISFDRATDQASSKPEIGDEDASTAATQRIGVTGDQLRAASRVVEFAVRKEQARFRNTMS
jgi:hypothetical protein